MSRRLGISSQLLGQYEKGEKNPKGQFFLKWKQVFGEDLLKLIETDVSQETQEGDKQIETFSGEAPPNYGEAESRKTLERTLENMSQDKIRSTAIIERLVALLERAPSFNYRTSQSVEKEPPAEEGPLSAALQELKEKGRTGPFSSAKKEVPSGSSKKEGK